MRRLWSILLFLPAVVLAQQSNPTPMPGMDHSQPTKMISGKDHPELISDITAYRLFFLAMAEDPNPTSDKQKRQHAHLAKASLGNLDEQAVVRILESHKIQYQAMIVKFNAEETAREQLGLPSQTAAFQDEINQMVQQTHDHLAQVLSKAGMAQLEALIQAEKSGMSITAQGAQ
jgi:hypothetical protein